MKFTYFLKYPLIDPKTTYCNPSLLGKFVKIDSESGYPYGVESIFDAKNFSTKDEAEHYRDCFPFLELWHFDESLINLSLGLN